MPHPIRSTLALSVLVVILAACGTTASTSPEPSAPPSSSPAEPSSSPSEAPSEEPDASPDVVGTITMVDGVSVGGPGGSIAEALAANMPEPMLVNGVFYISAPHWVVPTWKLR